MNKKCIKKVYREYLEECLPNKRPRDIFARDQSVKHSCEAADIENLIYIYGSYLAKQQAVASGVTIHYDRYSMTCFKILDEIDGATNSNQKKYWWQFWK